MNSVNPVPPAKNKSRQQAAAMGKYWHSVIFYQEFTRHATLNSFHVGPILHHEYTFCPTAKLGLLSREATSRSTRRHHCTSSASRHSVHRFEQETPGSVFWEQTTNKLLDLHVLNSA